MSAVSATYFQLWVSEPNTSRICKRWLGYLISLEMLELSVGFYACIKFLVANCALVLGGQKISGADIRDQNGNH